MLNALEAPNKLVLGCAAPKSPVEGAVVVGANGFAVLDPKVLAPNKDVCGAVVVGFVAVLPKRPVLVPVVPNPPKALVVVLFAVDPNIL